MPRLKPAACAALAAAWPAAAALALFALKGVPRPAIHDEFSYLFAAETFARGRASNSPHQFWRHFQSFDLLSQPTFMSRKPPAQGLFLALGEVLVGQPIAGVLLSVSAACAAVVWALLAFVEPPWALAGGLLAAAHPLVFSWTVSYWGGGVALLGGALALGAWARGRQRPDARCAAVFAAGLVILANSRPLEGLIVSAPLVLDLLRKTPPRSLLKKLAAPAACVLVPAAAAMAFYNFRVTGSALEFPYTAYERAYRSVPLFIWQPPGPERRYDVPEFDEYWNHWERASLAEQATWAGWLRFTGRKWALLGRSWLSPWPLAALAAAALALAPARLTLLLAWFVLAATVPLRPDPFPYYSAPAGALFFALVVLAARRLWSWRWRKLAAGRALVGVALAWSLAAAAGRYRDYASAEGGSWTVVKDDAQAKLAALPGKHLVFVRYGQGHSVHEEWVYNDPDPDSARIVWARELSPEEDAKLASYYRDRSVWEADVEYPDSKLGLLRRGPELK